MVQDIPGGAEEPTPDTLVEGREALGPSVGLKACGRPKGLASVQSAPGVRGWWKTPTAWARRAAGS